MQIHTLPTPLLSSNMYLICEDDHVIVIDPYAFEKLAIQPRDTVKHVDYIFLTHEHYDHISGTNALRERFRCPVICGASCSGRLPDSTKNFSRYFNAFAALQTGDAVPEELLPIQEYTTHADESFRENKEILWQGHHFELTETPGHSPGSICILLDKKILFSGDTLLPGGEQITRFPDGSSAQYEQYALPYLRSLPPDVLVYPGHYKAFRLGDRPLG